VKSEVDDSVHDFGLSISSKDEENGVFSYTVSGEPDRILMFVLHLAGPSGIRRNEIDSMNIDSNSNWGVY